MAEITRFCKKITEKDKRKALDMLRGILSDDKIASLYPELFKCESKSEVKSVCNRSEGYQRVIV